LLKLSCIAFLAVLSLFVSARPSDATLLVETGTVVSADPGDGVNGNVVLSGTFAGGATTLSVTTTPATVLAFQIQGGAHLAILSLDQIGLLAGYSASVTFDYVTGEPLKIHGDANLSLITPALSGTVTAVDDIAHTLTLQTTTGTVTLTLPAGAEFKIAQFVADETVLQLGDSVGVIDLPHSPGNDIAISIGISGPKVSTFTGNLDSVDVAAGTIVVGGNTFRVNANARILVFVGGVPLTSLQDLADAIKVAPLTVTPRYFTVGGENVAVRV
jgi:hypothetical protein